MYIDLGFAVFGMIFALETVAEYFYNSSLPSGWATLTVLISMFSGIQLIFLGILGEYLGAIFDEVKARPRYIIEEKINFRGEPAPINGHKEIPLSAMTCGDG